MLEEYQEKLRASEDSFQEKWRRVSAGLRSPRDSGEYKYAVNALQRVFGPSAASTTVCVVVILLLLICVKFSTDSPPPELDVTIVEPEIEPLDDIVEEIEPDQTEMVSLDPTFEQMAPADVSAEVQTESLGDNSTDELVPMSVATIKSPMVLRGLYGGGQRGALGRGQALGRYGGTGSSTAVLKALRWLKDNQQSDGSWVGSDARSGMTGLALLCYMAHGETPASPEFGETVEKAIQYLIAKQNSAGRFSGCGDHYVYGHAIASYGLAEAYGMTRIVMLKEPAERAIAVIVNGQQPNGAWDYDYEKGKRQDLSVSCWQIQALKAAKLAGLDVAGLEDALERSVGGLKRFTVGGTGYMAYTPGRAASPQLTAAAALCLQLLGKSSDPAVSRALAAINGIGCDWQGPGMENCTYSWYYAAQAKFQHGGTMWDSWNARMLPMLVQNQMEDGHWSSGRAHSASDVYDTTLCCLCLEVYYRYLPTYARVEEVQKEPKTQTERDMKVAVDLAL